MSKKARQEWDGDGYKPYYFTEKDFDRIAKALADSEAKIPEVKREILKVKSQLFEVTRDYLSNFTSEVFPYLEKTKELFFDEQWKWNRRKDGCEDLYGAALEEAYEQAEKKRKQTLSIPPRFRLSDAKAELLKLQEKAGGLVECLENLSTTTMGLLEPRRFIPKTQNSTVLIDRPSLDVHKINLKLRQLCSAIKEALRKVELAQKKLEQKPGGRLSERAPLRRYIVDLKVIFEDLTGRRAGYTWNPARDRYEGPFYDFVHAVIEIVNPNDMWSDNALGDQIKSALRVANKQSH